MNSHAGDWVRIHAIILEAGERAPAVPDETQAVPLEVRVKGWQVAPASAQPGDRVEIRTVLGRRYTGSLEAINPPYGHDFGAAIPELLEAGQELRDLLADTRGDKT